MAGMSCEWLANSNSMRLTAHHEGDRTWVTASHFPIRLLMSRELLAAADGSILHRRFRTVTIRLANGLAVYRMVRCWPMERVFGLRRLYVEEVPEWLVR